VGGSAEPAIRRAARLADGIFANAAADDFLRQIGWIRDECERIGRDPAELRIVHYSVMLPAASTEAAWRRYGDHVWAMMWKYSDMEASARRSGPPPSPPPLTDDRRRALASRSILAGPPDRILAELHELRSRAESPVEFVARSYLHTLEYDRQLELMERLADEIAPHL
jgi:alkanesulfonate monooxygenase SsuD/methylene tetrahydromethanopterin reductase-like flavin-dependent oxidoreductase (luciferase family)